MKLLTLFFVLFGSAYSYALDKHTSTCTVVDQANYGDYKVGQEVKFYFDDNSKTYGVLTKDEKHIEPACEDLIGDYVDESFRGTPSKFDSSLKNLYRLSCSGFGFFEVYSDSSGNPSVIIHGRNEKSQTVTFECSK